MKKRIETGTPAGDALGFPAALFSGWLEIFDDRRLYLYYIISRHKGAGNTQALLRRWLQDGYDLRVVKPSAVMQHIIGKLGLVRAYEYLPAHYDEKVEVWRKPPVLDPAIYTTSPRSRIQSL